MIDNSNKRLFIKRQPINIRSLIPSFRKSMDTKYQWLRNRFKMMRGIMQFHNSFEGRKFHRQLTRYLILRGGNKGDKGLFGYRK